MDLATIIRFLPSHSAFVTAQRNDPEIAEWLAEQPDGVTQKWTPTPHEWGLDRELLAAVFDRLGDLIAVVINTSGAKQKASPPAPFPRPVTEIEKARARVAARVEDELADLIEAAHESWRREQATRAGTSGVGTSVDT